MPRLPLLLIGVVASLVPSLAQAAEPASGPCPRDATALLDGLYRWHVADQKRSGPIDISSQSQRFTPYLQQRLRQALALTPGGNEGRFVDFDVFSGTQVSTFAARVLNCRPDGIAGLEARVAVTVGISSRGPEATPQILRYRLVPGSVAGWRIADITYPGEPPFRLSTVLGELLEPKR
ncbi:MAG: hypothetical protein ACKO0M_02410 [Cyanobium sp.]